MHIWDMRRELNEAKRQIRDAEEVASELIDFVADHADLRKASPSSLDRLKKQLKDYNIHTGRWKE